MKNIKLSKRLLCAAELVPQGARVADVGCDHAYLSIYLIESGRCAAAVASDIREGPLCAARKNIEKYGLEDKIKTVLASGLEKTELPNIDAVVIAGMGGEMINEIIRARLSELNDKTLILQPQSKKEELRRFLYENGFEIKDEKIVCEGQKLYNVILAQYSGKKKIYAISESYVSPPLLKSPYLPQYIEGMVEHLAKNPNCDKELIKKLESYIK